MPCTLPSIWHRPEPLYFCPLEHMEEAPPPAQSHKSPEPPEEVALEFRPEVKIAAAVLLLLAWVCVCFVFYRLGRQRGYEMGLSSDLVARQVNEEAVRNISYFLQVASADDKTLLDTVLKHEERLVWVKDPIVRREALGMLLSVLMERGLLLEAEYVVDEMLPPKTMEAPAWIARMQRAARCFAMAGSWEKALAYYRSVEESLLAVGDHELWREAVRERAILLAVGCGGSVEARLAGLQELLSRQQEQAADAQDLHAELLTLLGRVQQEQGESAAAEKSFRAALAHTLPSDALSASTLACYGASYLELNERDDAEKYLRAAVERREPGEAQRLFLVAALRDLATLSLNSNRVSDALSLLNSAGEVAKLCIPAESAFWPSLAEQRGWAFYMARDFDASLAEFRRALPTGQGADDRLRARPLEGIARNCLATGRVDEALPAVEECVKLRERFFPDAREGMGRVLLLLGQAYDQAGQAARAAEAYGRAAATLPEDHGGRAMALTSQAYSLMQDRQWEAAVLAWEALLPLLPADDAAFRERASAQLAECRKKSAKAAEPAPSAPGEHKAKSSRRSR